MADVHDSPDPSGEQHGQDALATEPTPTLSKSFTSPLVKVDDHDELHAGPRPSVTSHV